MLNRHDVASVLTCNHLPILVGQHAAAKKSTLLAGVPVELKGPFGTESRVEQSLENRHHYRRSASVVISTRSALHWPVGLVACNATDRSIVSPIPQQDSVLTLSHTYLEN